MSNTIKQTGSFAVFSVLAIVMAMLVFLVISGVLNPHNFALLCVGVMSVSAVVWFILLKRANVRNDKFDATNSSDAQGSGRSKYVRVALLLLLLVVSFWLTRGGPWAPRLVGASVLVLFLIGTMLKKPK
jgi:hypothetical protein